MSSHTIVVTSNVNDARNHSNHFYNKLGTPLDLSQGRWQVAVKKMIYLNSFLNIINETITIFHKQVEKIFYIEMENVDTSKNPYYVTEDKKVFVMAYQAAELYGFDIFVERQLEENEIWYSRVHNYKNATQWNSGFLPLKHNLTFEFDSTKGVQMKSVMLSFHIQKKETFTVPPGNYEHLAELLYALNSLKIPGVQFTVLKGMVHVGIKDPVETLVMNNHLELTLGFNNHKMTKATTAQHLPQMNRGRFAFFIYSNLVNNIRVGDMEVPLMDVVSIPKREYGEIISLDVVNPLYNPVAVKQVSEIEIMLATDSGERITFDNRAGNAKTLMVLHFQQVQ